MNHPRIIILNGALETLCPLGQTHSSKLLSFNMFLWTLHPRPPGLTMPARTLPASPHVESPLPFLWLYEAFPSSFLWLSEAFPSFKIHLKFHFQEASPDFPGSQWSCPHLNADSPSLPCSWSTCSCATLYIGLSFTVLLQYAPYLVLRGVLVNVQQAALWQDRLINLVGINIIFIILLRLD